MLDHNVVVYSHREDGVYGTRELERNIIGERVTAGLRRVKKEGKTLGRPRMIVDRERVRQLHGQGNSVRIIPAQLGLTKYIVHSIVAG